MDKLNKLIFDLVDLGYKVNFMLTENIPESKNWPGGEKYTLYIIGKRIAQPFTFDYEDIEISIMINEIRKHYNI